VTKKNYLQILIVFAAITALAGIFVFLNQGSNKNNANTAPATEWQTYQSDEHGFSIRYPKSWYHYSIAKESLTMPILDTGVWPQALEEFGSGDKEISNQPFYPDSERIDFSINVLERTGDYTDTEIINNLGFGEDKVSTTNINNQKVLYYIQDDTQNEIDTARMYSKKVLIPTSNFFYEISISVRDLEVYQKNQALIDDILNSSQLI